LTRILGLGYVVWIYEFKVEGMELRIKPEVVYVMGMVRKV
jgi:hypothetical protein